MVVFGDVQVFEFYVVVGGVGEEVVFFVVQWMGFFCWVVDVEEVVFQYFVWWYQVVGVEDYLVFDYCVVYDD